MCLEATSCLRLFERLPTSFTVWWDTLELPLRSKIYLSVRPSVFKAFLLKKHFGFRSPVLQIINASWVQSIYTFIIWLVLLYHDLLCQCSMALRCSVTFSDTRRYWSSAFSSSKLALAIFGLGIYHLPHHGQVKWVSWPTESSNTMACKPFGSSFNTVGRC